MYNYKNWVTFYKCQAKNNLFAQESETESQELNRISTLRTFGDCKPNLEKEHSLSVQNCKEKLMNNLRQ